MALLLGAVEAQAPVTEVRLFVPSDRGQVLSGLSVATERSGACFARSLADSERPDAYRCSTDDSIHDPCFLDPVRVDAVVCAGAPFAADVVVVRLSEPLPAPLAAHAYDLDLQRGRPWALELADGRRCTILTGATALVAGMRVDYGCDDGASLVGPIDRSAARWRVFVGSPELGPVYEHVPVAVAWF